MNEICLQELSLEEMESVEAGGWLSVVGGGLIAVGAVVSGGGPIVVGVGVIGGVLTAVSGW